MSYDVNHAVRAAVSTTLSVKRSSGREQIEALTAAMRALSRQVDGILIALDFALIDALAAEGAPMPAEFRAEYEAMMAEVELRPAYDDADLDDTRDAIEDRAIALSEVRQ